MAIDLEAYFRRIGYTGPQDASLDVLRGLHRLHPAAIPFENLSPLLGETPSLELEAVEHKLVRSGRGGYCYEHNRLFAGVLEQLGFSVTRLAARVLWGGDDATSRPRTHELLAVGFRGELLIVDVGFGGATLTAPIRLEDRLEQDTPHGRYRLIEFMEGFLLQLNTPSGWRSMYCFDLHPQLDVDFEPMNHFVATHPNSKFRNHLVAARTTETRRLALFDNRLSMTAPLGGEPQQQSLDDVDALRRTLSVEFGIALPENPGLTAALSRAVNTP